VAGSNPSPRIDALRKQVASGNSDINAFWKQVTAEGTPLVESIEKDRQHQLVTFLWRGTSETRNVFPVGSFKIGGLYPLDYVFHQIPLTDVWYLTVRLPTGARFTYGLSENDPLVFNGFQPVRYATTQVDRLNPHRWGCAPDATRYDCQSMAELKGAVPQPWIVKNSSVATGTIEKQKIHSEILKNEHDLSIYLPAGYRPNATPYNLVVIFDESAYLTKVPTPVILDNLIAASKIPPTVAVLIANPSQESRNEELTPNPKFADFLAKELIPWIHAHYNVTADPGKTVVAGSSLGGLTAAYVGYKHPEVFANVLCQSGSFWWAPDHSGAIPDGVTTETGWMAKQFIASSKLPLKFYIDAGAFEFDSNGTGGGILETSRDMRNVLLAKGYEVHYQQFVGGHDYLSWRGTLADGLIDLIGSSNNRRPGL
jgi:enterochelin esterase-like enzyme